MVPSWSRAKASRCWIRRAIRSPSLVTLRVSAAAAPPARSPSATAATRRSASKGSRPTAGCARRGALLVEPDLLHPAAEDCRRLVSGEADGGLLAVYEGGHRGGLSRGTAADARASRATSFTQRQAGSGSVRRERRCAPARGSGRPG